MTDQSITESILRFADEFSPEIKERAQEIEDARRMPQDIADRMAKSGAFRTLLPSYLNGLELSPREFVEIVERFAIADASVGWCAMIASTTGITAAYMPKDVAAEIYSSPEVVTGGVFAPMGKANVEGDGYRVTGQWQWGSGSTHSSWLGGGCFIFENGEMRKTASGAPENRMMVFPKEDAELIDTWHVAGLAGTGSGDIAVKDIYVPKSRSVSLSTDDPVADSPLYIFPVFSLLALGVCAVALGNARGALNSFVELAQVKKNQGSSKTLAERQVIQAEYAKMEASLRSARAYLMDEIEQTWHIANTTGAIPLERRAALRLACTNMTRTSADITRTAYDLGGGAALFLKSDLQRRFRDAHGATQHIVTAPATYELVGRLELGLPTDAGML